MGIHVHRKVDAVFLCGVNQGAHHIIMIRAAGVLCADGNLRFFAGKPVAHAAHIHGKDFGNVSGDGGGAAVSHLFKNGDMLINPAGGFYLIVL